MIHGIIAGQFTEAISVDIVEAATASDGATTGNIIFAALVDDPANVGDRVDAFLGEIMVEAATAAATVDAGLAYAAAIAEAATVTESWSGDVPSIVPADVAESATAADTPSATVTAAPGRWALVDSWTYSTPVTEVDFTGLAGYTEVRVVTRLVPSTGGLTRLLRVSTDNGSTFLSASGDYIEVAADGTATNTGQIFLQSATSASARSSEILITGWNLTANKVAQARHRTDIRQWIIPTSSALNALRIADSTGNLAGGSIYVFARS